MDHMPRDLGGKTALVTGASRGIGAAIAGHLAARGAMVAVHYSASADQAAEVVGRIEELGGTAFALKADLADPVEAQALFETLDDQLGRRRGKPYLDILINNAGRGRGSGFADTSEQVFDQIFDVNVKGLFFMCQQALTRLRDGGRVINITSVSARGAHPARPVYSASKLAANSLTWSLAAELAPRKITVNAIAPGAVATDLLAQSLKDPAFEQAMIATTAFGRLGEPDDIAAAVGLLVGDGGAWITGQIIEASGGMRL